VLVIVMHFQVGLSDMELDILTLVSLQHVVVQLK
jgi:hypothetical protein